MLKFFISISVCKKFVFKLNLAKLMISKKKFINLKFFLKKDTKILILNQYFIKEE